MEENPGHDIKTQTDQSDLKDQLINSSGENEVKFPNDGSKEKAEDVNTQEGNSQQENAQAKESDSVTSDSKELLDKTTVDNEENSAEVNCPICLGLLQNKSFTDSCFHTFCFTCLLEWSKVKAECPLCKQKFKSIVHNVRSIEDYDQYFISQKNQLSSTFEGAARRFRYHSTVTAERMLQRRRRMVAIADSFESQYASHRLLYAPHSVRSYTSSEVARIPCNFRSGIYDTGLWVKPTHMHITRTRDVSPAFYHENPACTHRLIPWLNRELVALLHNSESQVTFVLELIMALITRYDIQSQEFFVNIEPYLAPRTSHFVHEFYNFARSPYDMHRYDRCAVYSLSDQRSSTRSASPDSDVIPITETAAVSNGPSTSREATSSRHAEKERPVFRRLKKIVLKRNQESNLWQSVIHFQAGSSSTSVNSPTESVSSSFCLAGPSTSTYERFYKRPSTSVNVEKNDDESDCLIVDEMPPKSQRTPELISILSSDDDNIDQEKVPSRPTLISNNNDLITLSSDENSVYNLDYRPSDKKYSSHSDTYMFKSLSSDDDEKPRHPKLKTKHRRKKSWAREKRKTRPTSKSHILNDIHSIRPKTPNSEEHEEMHFLASPSTTSSWPKHNELSSLGLPADKSNKDGSSPSSTDIFKNSDAGTSALDTSNKGDTGTSAMDTYKSNSSTSAEHKSVAEKSNKGDSCMVVTDSKAVDFGSSTDSYSEVLSDMSTKPKKAKLRSVVAQVSATEHQDRTDHHHHDRSDSSRHSLHKRHKEKHKKKKHSHKHSHRSHSHDTD